MLEKTPTAKGKKVTVVFTLPADVQAKTAALVGDFNGWDITTHAMKRAKDGSFSLKVSGLEAGQSYRFRYLLDGDRWENDWQADDYLPNDFGTQDSVLQL